MDEVLDQIRKGATCAVCGKGFTEDAWDARHELHEEGCSHHHDAECDCDCDRPGHEDCCPECNPKPGAYTAPASL